MNSTLLFPSLVLLTSFLWMLVINAPIAVAIVLSTFLTLLSISSTIPLPADVLIAHRMAGSMESFALLAIPMFIVSGTLMGRGGMARRIMDFANLLLKRFPGGLALANILTCMLFGSISGSAVAAVSSIGGCMIPEMKRKGYPDTFSVAVTATAATTGLIIPPSNVIIVYAMSAGGLSISALFLAGILPGIVVGIMLMIFAMIVSIVRGYGKIPVIATQENLPKISFLKQFSKVFLNALPSLFIGVLVLGGIIAGIFTATEAAAVSVVYAFVLGVFFYKEIKLKELPSILLESGVVSSVVLLLIGASGAMSWVLAYIDIPQTMSSILLNISENKWVLLIGINIALLLVGTCLDMTPAILIFTPILLPVMLQLGIDPIHFGIFMITNLCVGLCTPPVGSCLFVGCTVGHTKLLPTTLAMIPFFVAMLIALAIIVLCPWLCTWLASFA